jgi:cytochrome c biogenesis protein CcmG, thiol:disulfide interchange protein DsbE
MNINKLKRVTRTAAVVLLAAAALALSACGGGGSSVDPGTDPPDYGPALAKAPPKLKALYEQGGKLVPGELDAFSEQLAAVRGYPAVVNNWASWCGPCRTEWPWLQQAAADNLDEVAFIGVDGDDSDDAAATFLRDHPVPYPSFADPDKGVGNQVGATLVGGFPNTLFFDRNGELVFTHQGVYEDQAALEADIRKYALGES